MQQKKKFKRVIVKEPFGSTAPFFIAAIIIIMFIMKGIGADWAISLISVGLIVSLGALRDIFGRKKEVYYEEM